jgi:hypothetical protein
VRWWTVTPLLLVVVVSSICLSAPADASQSGIRGFNWADSRDNYQDEWVIPSGLSASDTAAQAHAVATAVAESLDDAGAGRLTAVRMPINPPTALGDWWPVYQGAINGILQSDKTVILGYWEADKDGRIDDESRFQQMWDRVTGAYGADGDVMFEIMNEPFGYSASEWTDIAASWLSRYTANVPAERVIVDGLGYSENVVPVGDDSRLSRTALGLHVYGYWRDDTRVSDWEAEIDGRIGRYGDRVIVTEFGAPMTTGTIYLGDTADRNRDVAYLQAMTRRIKSLGMGSVYWPGVRDDDTFSMTTRQGEGSNIALQVNNESALRLLRSAWGGTSPVPTTEYPATYCYAKPEGQSADKRYHLTNGSVIPADDPNLFTVTYIVTEEQWDSSTNRYIPDPENSAVRHNLATDLSGDLNRLCRAFSGMSYGYPG